MINREPDSVAEERIEAYAPWKDGEECAVESVAVECSNGDVLRYTDRDRNEETSKTWVFETVETYEEEIDG